MLYEDLNHKIQLLELEMKNTNKVMEIFQSNINSNITWFLACTAIIIALLGVVGVAIYFIVQQAINKGVKSGIEMGIGDVESRITTYLNENLQFIHIEGKSNIMTTDGKMFFIELSGLKDLTERNFVSLSIINKYGKIIEYSDVNIYTNSIRISLNNHNLGSNGDYVYWNLLLKNEKFFTGINIIEF